MLGVKDTANAIIERQWAADNLVSTRNITLKNIDCFEALVDMRDELEGSYIYNYVLLTKKTCIDIYRTVQFIYADIPVTNSPEEFRTLMSEVWRNIAIYLTIGGSFFIQV